MVPPNAAFGAAACRFPPLSAVRCFPPPPGRSSPSTTRCRLIDTPKHRCEFHTFFEMGHPNAPQGGAAAPWVAAPSYPQTRFSHNSAGPRPIAVEPESYDRFMVVQPDEPATVYAHICRGLASIPPISPPPTVAPAQSPAPLPRTAKPSHCPTDVHLLPPMRQKGPPHFYSAYYQNVGDLGREKTRR